MTNRKIGPYLFPIPRNELEERGAELRDLFAVLAPEPDKATVDLYFQHRRNLNPHNDGPPKLKQLSSDEIRCALRYRFADEMLKAREIDFDKDIFNSR